MDFDLSEESAFQDDIEDESDGFVPEAVGHPFETKSDIGVVSGLYPLSYSRQRAKLCGTLAALLI